MRRIAATAARHPLAPWVFGLAGLGLILVSARPYAGGWNDGSRLAAVESLLERQTFRIDESVFCRPAEAADRGHPPYSPTGPFGADLLQNGTRDKLFINGHFYSDKPAVISALMAGVYRVGQVLGLPRPVERPDIFCWVLTTFTSGLAYLLAAISLYRLGAVLGLGQGARVGWVASFGLATVALTYTRHVNSHVMLLGVMSSLCLHAVVLARESEAGTVSLWRLLWIGTLAGIGFNLDLGAGPPLVLAVFAWVAYRCRRVVPVAIVALAAAPWGVAWFALNYAIGGTLKPIGMVADFMTWPGSPFSEGNMTGFTGRHPVPLPVYALELLVGQRGIILYNLPTLLVLPAMIHVIRRPSPYRPELAFGLGWTVAVWLQYSVFSNNYGGGGVSVRWFVPFLAPYYFLLAVYLRDCPRQRPIFWALSGWGVVLSALLWWDGPWSMSLPLLLWPLVAKGLATWAVMSLRLRSPERTWSFTRVGNRVAAALSRRGRLAP